MNRDFHRAGRCFALARSTTFAGERESAIRRGTEIAEKAGISLDEFDIPGRVRAAPRRDPLESLFEGSGIFGDNFTYSRPAPNSWHGKTADEIMSEIDELLGAAVNRRHDFAAERARRKVDLAVQFLKARGVRIVAYGDGTFTVADHHSSNSRVSGETVVQAAQSRGWRG